MLCVQHGLEKEEAEPPEKMLTFGELLEHMCGAFFVKGFQCTILSCSSVKVKESSTLGSGADLGTARNKYCNCAGRPRVICSGSAFC